MVWTSDLVLCLSKLAEDMGSTAEYITKSDLMCGFNYVQL